MDKLNLMFKLAGLSEEIKPLSKFVNDNSFPIDIRKKVFEEAWLPLHRAMLAVERELGI